MRIVRITVLVLGVLLAFWLRTASAKVMISEILWSGTDISTADEWVEIVGLGLGLGSGANTVADDLSGWLLTTRNSSGEDVPIIRFATGTVLASGAYLVISNYDAGDSRLAIAPDMVTTAVLLPNTKLQLKLYDASGTLIDVADDGIGVPMAGMNASGTGWRASMERIRFDLPGDNPAAWQTARTAIGLDPGAPVWGTPGFPNGSGTGAQSSMMPESSSSAPASLSSLSSLSSSTSGASLSSVSTPNSPLPIPNPNPILITEVLANPIGRDDDEWIEIGNTGTGAAVSIAGWILDEGNGPGHFVIPSHRTATGAYPPLASTGFVLSPGEHVSFRKSVTGLALDNGDEDLWLWSGSTLVDHWVYTETAEEVSFGRFGAGTGAALRSFCVPTEGMPNAVHAMPVRIGVQSTNGHITASGSIEGEGSVSVNLEASTDTGSLASAVCQWSYSDGFTSSSCNPPSHAFKAPGVHTVSVEVRTFCGDQILLELAVHVREKAGKEQGKKNTMPEEKIVCSPSAFGGMRISEVLPNPYGDETEGEWIELQNTTAATVDLCGWLLDDEEGGSKPYTLDGESVQPGGYLLLPRLQTRIALNNTGDSARLFAPGAAGAAGVLVDAMHYARAPEGESLALREDGHAVWTPYPTPQQPNRFRSAQRSYPTDTVIVSASLPNPFGKDAEGEWIEIANVGNTPMDMDGWWLDNREGGSPPFALNSIHLEPGAVRRIGILESGISLRNSQDIARLLDPEGYVVSVLGWAQAVEGRIYRPPVLHQGHASVRIVRIVDGDTIDVALTNPDEFSSIPSSLKRRWLGLAEVRSDPVIRVRMIGIDTPETVHPAKAVEAYGAEASAFVTALLHGKNAVLEFDAELWDKYDRLLAYVYTVEGDMVQRQLLRSGLAYAYLRFPFARADEFAALECEARSALLGIWSSAEAVREIEALLAEEEEERILEERGLTLVAKPPPGRVASGTVVTFTPSVKADLYVSINSGAFTAFSGTYIVQADASIAAFAAREASGTVLVSPTVHGTYLLERASYAMDVTINEAYPSPNIGEQEWIEIANRTAEDVQLGGWLLDDVRGGGSRPWTVPPGVRVPGSGTIIFTKEQTGLALNNDGDEIWLITPDGCTAVTAEYGKVKKGRGVVFGDAVEAKLPIAEVQETVVAENVEQEEWAGTLLFGTQLIRMPQVHPRRQGKMAELGLELGLGMGLGLGVGSGELEEEDEGAIQDGLQIVFRAPMACITDVPTPGAPNSCVTFEKEKISKKSQGKEKKTAQKNYTKNAVTSGGMQWLRNAYRNLLPGTATGAPLPAVHRMLAALAAAPRDTKGEAHGTSPLPYEAAALLCTIIAGCTALWYLRSARVMDEEREI